MTEVQTGQWKERGSDPNAISQMKVRSEQLDQAFQKFRVVDRIQFFSDAVKGKKVLDIGVVNHVDSAYLESGWLHGAIRKAASSCLGVDILESAVKGLVAEGYQVVCHNVVDGPLSDTFDVVTCGELVEHIGNLDGLFSNCAKMLVPGGQMILSTPNPWYLNPVIKNVLGKRVFVESVDHVVWFAPSEMFELGQRHGFRLIEWHGTLGVTPQTWLGRISIALLKPLLSLFCNPALFSKSLIYILKKV